MRAEFRKGEQWIVQRMHISVLSHNCTPADASDDIELLNDDRNDYLEAWKIGYKNKGWTYKPYVKDGGTDTWHTQRWEGRSGTTSWRGEAIWAKKTGPGGWARGQGEENGDFWGTLRGTTNNIDEKWQKYRWAEKRSGVKKREHIITDWDCCP
jgi:hypothetical protein